MKRILHALAALLPERREYHNTWLPDARNGLLRHAVAVLRVEHAMEELALCKEPKAQPVNAPDADTDPQTKDEPNNRLNLISRLAGRRITVPGSSELASLPEKADLRIRVFAKTNLLTRSQTPLNPGYRLVFAIITLFMCLTAAQQVSAQVEPADAVMADIKPLQIGDTIPEYLWHLPLQVVNHPEGKEMITLNDYRGKLIILDFWATWCGPCVAMIPKIEGLQHQLSDQVAFLAITYQQKSEVSTFMEKLEAQQGKTFEIPNITNDVLLSKYFVHRVLPHYVWIDGRGTVFSTTDHNELSADKIVAAHQGENIIKPKYEEAIDYDPSKSLHVFTGLHRIKHTSSLIGYIAGLSAGYSWRSPSDNSGIFRITGRNMSLYRLYSLAIGTERNEYLQKNRFIFEVLDPQVWDSPDDDLDHFRKWQNTNSYCYELIMPALHYRIGFQRMKRDLDEYFPQFTVTFEKRETPCIVLIRTSDEDKLKTKGSHSLASFDWFGCKMQNMRLQRFFTELNAYYLQHSPIPIVNGTDYSGNVDLELDADLTDIDSINDALAAYDLKFVKQDRAINMVVVRDNSSFLQSQNL